MALRLAEAAVRIKATGVDEARAKILKLDGTLKSAMRAPAGAERALAPLRQRIDLLAAAAQRESTRTVALRKLEGVEVGLQRALERANLSLAQRVKLEGLLRAAQDARAASSARAAAADARAAATPPVGMMGRMGGAVGLLRGGLAGLGITLGVGALFQAGSAAAEGADAADAAARKLSATSRITGVEMAKVAEIAADVEERFTLSSSAAADLTANTLRLTNAAGRVNDTAAFTVAWMDLAAARGLSLADAGQALETTLIGQDEGLNKLGLANPQQIYEKWAGALGTTASKMTDAQKQQAIMNEVMAVGARVQGEYEKRLASAEGQTDRTQQATTRMAESFGRALRPIRSAWQDGLMRVSAWVRENEPALVRLGSIIGGTLRIAFGTLGDAVATGADVAMIAWDTVLAAIERVAAGIIRAAGRIGQAMAKIASLVPGMAESAGRMAANAASMLETADRLTTDANARDARSAERVGGIQRRAAGTMQRARDVITGRSGESAAPTTGGTTTGTGTGGAPGAGGGGAASAVPLGNVLAGREATEQMLPDAVATRATEVLAGAPIAPITVTVPVEVDADVSVDSAEAAVQGAFDSLGPSLTNVLGATLAAAFSGGMGDAGSVLLQGLGGIMQQMGSALITYGLTMSGLLPALMNPFTSGPAALAAGAALVALGGLLAGIATGSGRGGGSRGGGGGFVAPQDTTTRIPLGRAAQPVSGLVQRETPQLPAGQAVMPLQPVTVNATIIGPNDPVAQRQIVELVRNANRRGL